MHYSFSIALRYLKARHRSGFVSRVTLIAVGGTLVGVTTLVIVLSLMNGFESELRSRIIEFNTHVLLFARSPKAWADIDSISAEIGNVPGVISSSPFVRGESILNYELIPGIRVKTKGVIIKGIEIERERNVSTVIDSFYPPVTTFETGGFYEGEELPGIVLGQELADDLRISLAEELTLVSAPADLKAGEIVPRLMDFRVIGFFKTGVFEFDSRFCYIDIRDASKLYDFESSIRGLGIKVDDIYRAKDIDDAIQERLQSYEYGTNNWIDMNSSLFSYIKVEKILMFLLLALIILIAAFNLVGMLTMVIMEKRSEIGILRSMGASSRGIMSIFMVEGTIIGLAGTVLGVLLGYGICMILSAVHLDLPADIYFINTLPVVVKLADILMVSAASLVICFAATIYPSWEACKMPPLDAIRFD
ncbi:MAG: FtsX-like permease family protein [Candidatus Krumholzibacteriota bacterium]|nr:FtsX-like permease family protein [Candidatus Krumholzibacteriota bacterium]